MKQKALYDSYCEDISSLLIIAIKIRLWWILIDFPNRLFKQLHSYLQGSDKLGTTWKWNKKHLERTVIFLITPLKISTFFFFFSTNGTPFIFRVGQGSEMERAIKLDRELTEYGRGVLLTDTLSACLKKAAQWAQTGLVVSVGPVDLLEEGSEGEKSVEGSGDPEIVCKARNSRLSRLV